MLFLMFLCGCSPTPHAVTTGFYSYDEEKVSSVVEKVKFDTDVPGFIPLPMVSMVSDIYQVEQSEMLDLNFYSRENDLFTIQITSGGAGTSWVEPEKIKIEANLQGTYEDNRFSKKLQWEKDGITYVMTYRASVASDNTNEQRVTQQQLVEVARSFH
ncbi:hypothetical protein [Halobacillus dabanensis]|nr:hypothetical protein [Halobacillus dabanensis]